MHQIVSSTGQFLKREKLLFYKFRFWKLSHDSTVACSFLKKKQTNNKSYSICQYRCLFPYLGVLNFISVTSLNPWSWLSLSLSIYLSLSQCNDFNFSLDEMLFPCHIQTIFSYIFLCFSHIKDVINSDLRPLLLSLKVS